MAEVDSITGLAQELDETRVKAFIRREMWEFFRDLGWVTDPESPPNLAKARPAKPHPAKKVDDTAPRELHPPRVRADVDLVEDAGVAVMDRAKQLAELRRRFVKD